MRIIPTCVGKTCYSHCPTARVSDHPHVRGENDRRALCSKEEGGSSPRAWGKLGTALGIGIGARIIPTCVGKTLVACANTAMPMDHPHVRGENFECVACNGGGGGSSPRAWGKQERDSGHGLLDRIIPTCVGKTAIWSARSSRLSDHPHVRGENLLRKVLRLREIGSSPRAWGKL